MRSSPPHPLCLHPQHRASSQLYTPVNGWRDAANLEILPQAPVGGGACLPPVWAWALHYSAQQRAQFQNPIYTRASDGHTAPPGCSKVSAVASVWGGSGHYRQLWVGAVWAGRQANGHSTRDEELDNLVFLLVGMGKEPRSLASSPL